MNTNEYITYLNELRNNIENCYKLARVKNNTAVMAESVTKLMQYGLISRNDERLCLIGFDKEKDTPAESRYDFRAYKNSGFVPRNIWFDVDDVFFNMNTIEHWGKRVEGRYTGDIVIKPFASKIGIEYVHSTGSLNATVDELQALLKQAYGRVTNETALKRQVGIGMTQVFRVEFKGNTLANFRTIGIGIVKVEDDNTIKVSTVLRYRALYNNWISIKGFIENLKPAILKSIKTGIIDEINISMNKPDEAIKRQIDMIDEDKLKGNETSNKAV